MGNAKRAAKKLQKSKEKARAKRYRKVNNGLDICLIAFCFLTFLAAAVTQMIRENAGNNS